MAPLHPFFEPIRGIRQGDPLSPYIFILSLELLTRYIEYQVDIHNWDTITIGRKSPSFSHLFFADDLTFMAKANTKSFLAIKLTIELFFSLSGQSVNHSKSKVLFSKNCRPEITKGITNMLGIKKSDHFGIYLGFAILNRNPRPNDYLFIIEKMWSRLAS